MPTTSQLLGLSPQEKAAAIFTALGEAGPGRDKAGVFSTLLSRKAINKTNIADLAKMPSQFVANDPYTLQQITSPEFGKKVYGKRYSDYEKAFENPDEIIHGLRTTQGATQFRGQSLLSRKRKGDPMLDPKGNFWLEESKNPKVAETLIQQLQKGRKRASADEGQSQDIASAGGNTYVFLTGDDSESDNLSPGAQFLQLYKDTVLPQYQEKQADILNLAGSVPSFIDTAEA